MDKMCRLLQVIDICKQSVKFNTRLNDGKQITSKGSTMGGLITLVFVTTILASAIMQIDRMMKGELDQFEEKTLPSYSNFHLWKDVKSQMIKKFVLFMPIFHISPASNRSLEDFGIKTSNGEWNMDELFRYFEIGRFTNEGFQLVVPCQRSDLLFF